MTSQHPVPGSLLARVSAAAVCVLICMPPECAARSHPGSAALKHRIDLVQKLAATSNRLAYAESTKERPSYSLQHLPVRATRRDRRKTRARKQEARDRYGQVKYKGLGMGKLISKIGGDDVEFYKKGIRDGQDEEWWRNDHTGSGIECCGVNCCGSCCGSRRPSSVTADPEPLSDPGGNGMNALHVRGLGESGILASRKAGAKQAVDVGQQGSVISTSRSGIYPHKEGAEQLLTKGGDGDVLKEVEKAVGTAAASTDDFTHSNAAVEAEGAAWATQEVLPGETSNDDTTDPQAGGVHGDALIAARENVVDDGAASGADGVQTLVAASGVANPTSALDGGHDDTTLL